MITADDIAKEFYPLLYSHQRDYLKDQINAAIVAAVQAEREACANAAESAPLDSRPLIAAAIRARK